MIKEPSQFNTVYKGNSSVITAAGLSVTGLYTDEMLVRTPLQPEGTGETFYAGNYRFGLSYARYLTDRVTVCATVSYISMTLYEGFSADAMSADIAAYYVSDFRGFRFGMQISHFGSEVKYVNESTLCRRTSRSGSPSMPLRLTPTRSSLR